MAIEIKIPRLGWSMDEGKFNGWLKKNGDLIKSGDPLFTLESEKSAEDIESTDGGLLHIPKVAPEAGATVIVGQVIGYLVKENEVVEPSLAISGEQPAEKKEEKKEPSKVNEPNGATKAGTPTTETRTSSPRARRRVVELGVNLNELEGSGSTGRIVEADVVKAAAGQGGQRSPTSNLADAGKSSEVSMMRRNIAERTAFSFSNIPHFYLRAELDASELLALRGHLVGVLERECGVRVTLTDFLLRAQAMALNKFPEANAVWRDNGILKYNDADVGLVVGLPDGLVIPILRSAQKMSLVQLAKERTRLVEAVRKRQFDAEMLSGGAASISNLGTTRTDEFSAVIAPHQSSMLAVGRAAQRPYVVDGRLDVRFTLRLCLSVDHRVMDGGPAAEFFGLIIQLLEDPEKLV
jgi:pyruvate dehydrogenase E2 component (dihydrolipoamide acetyltransferase)